MNEKACMTTTTFKFLRTLYASKGVQGKNILLFTHPQNTPLLQNVEVDFHKGLTWRSADVINQLLHIVRPSACHNQHFQP